MPPLALRADRDVAAFALSLPGQSLAEVDELVIDYHDVTSPIGGALLVLRLPATARLDIAVQWLVNPSEWTWTVPMGSTMAEVLNGTGVWYFDSVSGVLVLNLLNAIYDPEQFVVLGADWILVNEQNHYTRLLIRRQ
jgi:hypothetical protein